MTLLNLNYNWMNRTTSIQTTHIPCTESLPACWRRTEGGPLTSRTVSLPHSTSHTLTCTPLKQNMHNEHCQPSEHNHFFRLLTCRQLRLKVSLPHSTSHTRMCTTTPSVCWHADNSDWKYCSHTPPVTHWCVQPLLPSADMWTTANEKQDAEWTAFRTQPLLQSDNMWTTQAERQDGQWTAFRTQPLLQSDNMWTTQAERRDAQ